MYPFDFYRSFIFALHGKVEASPPDKKRTLDLNDRPQGTIQFIEAWFSLLEKMVNPRTVLESNHMLPKVMPPGDGRNFDANLYLQQMHWVQLFYTCSVLYKVLGQLF